MLGADVTGFALPPPTNPALFEQLGLASRIHHVIGDVRDLAAVRKVVAETKPDFVFHFAAQSLVRLSYEQPVETYATNVMGTVNVLEALRCFQSELNGLGGDRLKGSESGAPATSQRFNDSTHGRAIAAVMVTTDKCYENKEWVHSYREEDPMGGYDPYSSSKGAAELVTAAYRRSFFNPSTSNLNFNSQMPRVCVASARAGNVIGGGDWALDRIVPDCIRSLQKGEAIPVRNKVATRPWQHVLEPLSGYLLLASEIAAAASSSLPVASSQLKQLSSPESATSNQQPITNNQRRLADLCSAFNFGPAITSNRTVAELVQEILKHWPGRWEDKSDPNAVHEAKLLNLATDKGYHSLGWKPVWNFTETIEHTASWYSQVAAHAESAPALTRTQITAYQSAADAAKLPWASV